MGIKDIVADTLVQLGSVRNFNDKIFNCEINLAGVTFEGRQKTLNKVDARTKIKLVREPENIYDPNRAAISVITEDERQLKLGYIPRKINQKLAVMMDAGEGVSARIRRVIGGGEKNLGIIIVVEKEN